ncbi:MAG: cadmium-translocating P-type ATPase [Chloroflexi bacterium]|nr:cadmium-translocating P-type ATPase [Chloroflexota bacterium]
MTGRTYRVEGMDCANCARELEDGIRRLSGVEAAHVDYMGARLIVTGSASFEQLQVRANALGKSLHNEAQASAADQTNAGRGGAVGFVDYLLGANETRMALAGALLAVIAVVLAILGVIDPRMADGLLLGALVVAVIPIARSGINGLRINRRFNINMLMTIAAVGAVIIGEMLEAAVVVILFAVGEALEGYTVERARRSIRALLALKPRTARRIDSAGIETQVAADALTIGDRVVVRSGEAVPGDGVIVSGRSAVNQAPITGESLPVERAEGDAVYAGTINGDGVLHIEITAAAEDNTLSRIVKLVEESQAAKAPTQRMIDSFAAIYTPAVALLALAVAVLPPLLFSAPFFDTPESHGWLYRALALLVIACPCALVISTPVTVISGLTAAARRGVLIKGGAHLEMLGRVKAIALDKTGTVTEGRPQVVGWRSLECTGDPACAACDDLLGLAAAVEQRSAHPLAEAVVAAAAGRANAQAYSAAESVESLPGRGIHGTVDGHDVLIGSHAYFDAEHPHADALCSWAHEAESQGSTTMLVKADGTVQGAISFADTLRADAGQVVSELHTLGLNTAMLTGDHEAAARTIAKQVGIETVYAGLLPADKADAIRRFRESHGVTAMVGDGVNDAPALAAADIGVAMGAMGSPQAVETADVALMGDNLRLLPLTIRLARFTRSVIRQNIALSFALKAIFMVLALEGSASLWAAVFADVGMALIVTVNGMRPLRWVRTAASA